MRLFEITEPDPKHAELAREVEDVYRRLYSETFDALRRFPPRGGQVVAERRAVVFPYDALVGRGSGKTRETSRFRTVADVLRRLGWHTDPDLYRQGTATREEEYVVPDTPRVRRTGGTPGAKIRRTRRMSIARILDQAMRDPEALRDAGLRRDEVEAAKKAFENDPTRRGTATERRGDERVLVVSFDPLETAHAGERRPWSSCWRIGGAEEANFREALACAIATAWLTTRDDISNGRWIDHPTARWILVPYVDPHGGKLVALHTVTDSSHIYGSPPPGATHAVEEAARRIARTLAAALGPRIGKPTVRAGLLVSPPIAGPRGPGDPAAIVAFLFTNPPASWISEIPFGSLPRVHPGDLERAAHILENDPTTREAARALRGMIDGSRQPRNSHEAAAAFVLASVGALPARAVPPPETLGDAFCPGYAASRMAAPRNRRRPSSIWHDTDAAVALILAALGGCLYDMADVPLPDPDTALHAARRVARAMPAHAENLARFVDILAGHLDAGTFRSDPLSRLALEILVHARGPEGIDGRLAAIAPDEILDAAGSSPIPRDIAATAKTARALSETGIEDPSALGRRLADIAAMDGMAAVVDALRTVAETGDAGEGPRRRAEAARRILAVVEDTPHTDHGVDWDALTVALEAGLVRPRDALAEIEVENFRNLLRNSRGPVPVRVLRLPKPLRMAVVLAAGRIRGLASPPPILRDFDRESALRALRTIVASGNEDLAARARRLAAAIEGRGTFGDREGEAVPAIFALAAGLIEPKSVRAPADPEERKLFEEGVETLASLDPDLAAAVGRGGGRGRKETEE